MIYIPHLVVVVSIITELKILLLLFANHGDGMRGVILQLTLPLPFT